VTDLGAAVHAEMVFIGENKPRVYEALP